MAKPNQDSEEKGEDLWASILNDIATSGAKSKPVAPKSLLVLGDVCSGKSTLIDKLCALSPGRSTRTQVAMSKFLLSGCSLEYRFIDVQDEETDDFLARMGVWNLDGVVWHSQLLPFVLHKSNIRDTIAMIVVDLSQPWGIIESLERWIGVLNKHINSLNIPAKQQREMEENMMKMFQSYVDPELQSVGSGGPTVITGEGDDVVLPLDDNVLSCNLGVPIVVVCAKSDSLKQLERNQGYKDEHFDFIQQHIRKFCLNYGAALVYTSTKEIKNCDILHQYLIHMAYRLPFRTPASIVERDAVFVPAGWDSNSRIALLCEQMKHISPRQPLQSIIAAPRPKLPPSQVEEVSAEDDQVFLLAQQAHLSKTPSKSSVAAMATASASASPLGAKQPSPRPSPSSSQTDISEGGVKSSSSGGGEQVLANFFTTLLNKNKSTTKASRLRTSAISDSDKKKPGEK